MLGDKLPPTRIEPRSSRFCASVLTMTARLLALVAEWLSDQHDVHGTEVEWTMLLDVHAHARTRFSDFFRSVTHHSVLKEHCALVHGHQGGNNVRVLSFPPTRMCMLIRHLSPPPALGYLLSTVVRLHVCRVHCFFLDNTNSGCHHPIHVYPNS